MTVKKRIDKAICNERLTEDTVDRLIAMAYYYGAETIARRVCDEHNKRGRATRDRIYGLRYWRQAYQILNDCYKPIYEPNYAGDMMSLFGNDETAL